MTILVTYASKHGATKGIAERIAGMLGAKGQKVEVRPVDIAGDLAEYEAFVIGSAVYFGHWRKEAVAFVRQNGTALAKRPVWLFSSGPLGTETTDSRGQDPRAGAEPQEIAALKAVVGARDHRVFFGALDRGKFDFAERLLAMLPAARALFVEGDFRDWRDIESWASAIAGGKEQEPPFGAAVSSPGSERRSTDGQPR